ncbi:MAG: hypothetical protein PHC66_02950 [Candidatus Nanoarchaeia archaeon]|nr:hypothetical protein [Candidatus Nanoarchaeia archaeon]MDD5239018.1 hypothetical protein [Candidatus Nanoarchaeia archaeon]
MDIRKIIFGVMVLLFLVTLFVPVKGVPEEKRCSGDSECEFVRTVCCQGCSGGFDSVNVEFSTKMNNDMLLKCNDTDCPPNYCEGPYGEAYKAVPKCINGECSVGDSLKCTAVCSYYAKNNTAPYKVYFSNIAIAEGLSQEALIDKCEC